MAISQFPLESECFNSVWFLHFIVTRSRIIIFERKTKRPFFLRETAFERTLERIRLTRSIVLRTRVWLVGMLAHFLRKLELRFIMFILSREDSVPRFSIERAASSVVTTLLGQGPLSFYGRSPSTIEIVFKFRYDIGVRCRSSFLGSDLKESLGVILQRAARLTLRVILIILVLQARNLVLIFDDSKQLWNWVLRESDLYLVTFVLPRGIQKRLSFIFRYFSNFTGGLNVPSQFFVFQYFDVLLGFAEFGEPVFRQVLVNTAAST